MRPKSHVRQVIELFDLTPAAPAPPDPTNVNDLIPAGGQIVLLTGPSGAGKSTLLKLICKSIRCTRIELGAIRLPDRPVIDCLAAPATFTERLALLSRVGLAEAQTYLRRPREISEGQRFRLRLAMGLQSAAERTRRNCARGCESPATIVSDEFAAALDDVTAAVVCRALRRAIDASGRTLAAVVASGREQLIDAIAPDTIARCDFGVIESNTARRPRSSVSY